MRVTRLAVAVEARFGDNDYGSQRAQAELTAELDAADDPVVCLEVLVAHAKARVLADLRQSPTLAIRRKANPKPRLCEECGDALGDDDQYLHPACEQARHDRREQERLERQQRYEEEERRRQAELGNLPESTDEEIVEDLGIPTTSDDDAEQLVGTAASGAEDDPF